MLTPKELYDIYITLPDTEKAAISAIAKAGGTKITAQEIGKIINSCPDTIYRGARQQALPFALAIKNEATGTYKYKFSRPAFYRWIQEGSR